MSCRLLDRNVSTGWPIMSPWRQLQQHPHSQTSCSTTTDIHHFLPLGTSCLGGEQEPENDGTVTNIINTRHGCGRLPLGERKTGTPRAGTPKASCPPKKLPFPRDIRMLNLSDLQGIEAEGRLTVFLSQVESCSEDLEERKRILMTRVDSQLALYIQNALSQFNFTSWDTLTYWLCEEQTDNNVDRILNSISEVKYDWLEDPQNFATKLKCKYAILEAVKTSRRNSRRDKIIKTKLLRGLPSHSKDKLEFYMDEQFH
ncbi:hypothetical protein GWK47_022385 [Chionoecetes opilio]|uniref:Uncharacterized protein n=1 Tax=Chionoecetes opilio TaxID=41210 RepID=A0A8J4XNN1_CHIOP|nr:hypothetical protein GWK47_022385 [Chionoecetes opilio]